MSQEEQRWVKGVQASEEPAFEAMFHAYYRDLCAFAAGYVGTKDLAREVVQDVFLKIWDRRAEWRLRGTLKSYLYGAVRNQALNYLDRTKRRAEVTLDVKHNETTGLASPTDDLHSKELATAFWKAVDELPPRRRRAFVLHRQHGLTYEEVAQTMEVKKKTVENQIGRALKFLRERLSPEYL